MSPLPALKDCEYRAFISYAHADDVLAHGWVKHFEYELSQGLDAAPALREVKVKLPPVHLSGENGPVAGSLSEELKARVARSFAMIIVVHENYALSDWCLKELEYFHSLWGEAGKERLYVLALSQGAIDKVKSSPAWKRLMPTGDQLWMPFFAAAEPTKPLNVYIDKQVKNPEFTQQFDRLRENYVRKVRAAADQERKAPVNPTGFWRDVPPRLEASSGMGTSSAAQLLTGQALSGNGLGLILPGHAPLASAPKIALGFGSAHLESSLKAVAQALQARGIQVTELSKDDVGHDFAGSFEGVRQLVLPIDDAPLSYTALAGAGGHLHVQRQAWLTWLATRVGQTGGPAAGQPQGAGDDDGLLWLDLRAQSLASGASASPGAQWLGSLPSLPRMLHLPDLLERLVPSAKPLSVQNRLDVLIYIESNPNETHQWMALGEQLNQLVADPTQMQAALATLPGAHAAAQGILPKIALRPKGLSIDRLDEYGSLDVADGVVLLWGQKSFDTLRAQMDRVESKMSGRDAAPALVAYLAPPQVESAQPVPAADWQVLRFAGRANENGRARELLVHPQEREELRDFLARAVQRRLERLPANLVPV